MVEAWRAVRSGGTTESLTQGWLRGDDDGASAQGAMLISPFQQSSWVYSAITALATNVSQIPFHVCRGGRRDGEHVISGPAADLFKRPHEQLDRFQFWELLVSWLHLRGEAFVVALNSAGRVIPVGEARGRNAIAQLLILSPLRFWHIIEGGELVGWRYTGFTYVDPPMESQVFLPEELMQLRLPNPYDFWRGFSPLAVAMLAAQTDYASSQFMKGLMLNNADTGVIVTTDQQVKPEQREAILAALRDRKRKAGTADRPIFLSHGAKVEKPAVTSADLQFLENRKLNRLEIGSVFRVPPTVMGFSEDANRAVAQQERLNFVEQTIMPLCARLEAFAEPIVKSFGRDLCGWFDADCLPIMQEARRQRGDAAAKFFAMGVPLNDINRAFDLGLPRYPWGATGYLPDNVQAIGTVTQSVMAQIGNTEKEADAFTRMLDALEKTEMPQPAEVKTLRSKLNRFFFEQRGRLLAKLAVTVPVGGIKIEGLEEEQRGSLWPVLGRTLAGEIFEVEQEERELMNRLGPWFEGRREVLAGVNQETFARIGESLEAGLKAGEDQAQLAGRMKMIFQDAADCRAEVIALGETRTAAAAGLVHINIPPMGGTTPAQPRILVNGLELKEEQI